MGQTTSRSAMRQKITAWRRFLMIFALAAFLSGCSDPSHPAAIKVLKEIEDKVSVNGQVALSSISEQFDEVCAFRQDDSDDGFALMDMQNFLSKKGIVLLNYEKNMPKNPQRIILLVRNKSAMAAYDGEWSIYYMLFKGLEIEDGLQCRSWSGSAVVARKI